MRKITEVAVAVFLKADGAFLLSSRPEGKPFAGYWEFPGGKIEPGESVKEALVRELVEELNVTVTEATPWFTFNMHYTHATVRLHCWRVTAWEGEMRGMEAQRFEWQRLASLSVAPTLPGCVPIFEALSLPAYYALTHAGEIGIPTAFKALEAALDKGLRLIQVREKTLSATVLRDFARQVTDLAHQHGARVLINSDVELAQAVGADGVHLTSAQLGQLTARPDLPLVGASTHSRAELEQAAALKCNFAVLGPVQPTLSHPGLPPLGWDRFAEMVQDSPLPCYALGGLSAHDLVTALQHGAQGVAMQRGLAVA
ncbi:MAG: Nudix family hydrolase [Betaproteobacteria bacterium]|nr:Nudix family hydrolase [Betaproteobacteria bacterium]